MSRAPRHPMLMRLLASLALLLAGASTSAQTFTDVTGPTGTANSTPNVPLVSTSGSWGDYDGDGDLDLYVTNWAATVSSAVNRLYRNNGGSFSDVAGQMGVFDQRNSIAAGWVDYDNDGDLDLYVVNFYEQDQLYRNDGGRFTRVTDQAMVNVISQGDETGATWGDYDGDGNIDLYLAKRSFRNTLFRNNGDGTFSERGEFAGVDDTRDSEDAEWGDSDADGDLDLYVVNKEQANAYYRNDGNGRFTEIACAISIDNTDVGRSANWIDVDNDDDLDLFVASIGANALYRNDGNDVFVNIATGPLRASAGSHVTWAGAWADYDGDGFLDVFLASGAESAAGQRSQLIRNSGGVFVDVTGGTGLKTSASSAIHAAQGDYDGDGDIDLYVVNSRYPTYEANVLYRNTTTGVADNAIRLVLGRDNAADGAGTIVRLLQNGQLVTRRDLAWGANVQQVSLPAETGITYQVRVNDGSTSATVNASAGNAFTIRFENGAPVISSP